MNGTGYSTQTAHGSTKGKKSSVNTSVQRDKPGARKAASADTRDRYGQPLGYSQQKRVSDRDDRYDNDRYNSNKKNLTQQVSHKDQRQPSQHVSSSVIKPRP